MDVDEAGACVACLASTGKTGSCTRSDRAGLEDEVLDCCKCSGRISPGRKVPASRRAQPLEILLAGCR